MGGGRRVVSGSGNSVNVYLLNDIVSLLLLSDRSDYKRRYNRGVFPPLFGLVMPENSVDNTEVNVTANMFSLLNTNLYLVRVSTDLVLQNKTGLECLKTGISFRSVSKDSKGVYKKRLLSRYVYFI